MTSPEQPNSQYPQLSGRRALETSHRVRKPNDTRNPSVGAITPCCQLSTRNYRYPHCQPHGRLQHADGGVGARVGLSSTTTPCPCPSRAASGCR